MTCSRTRLKAHLTHALRWLTYRCPTCRTRHRLKCAVVGLPLCCSTAFLIGLLT